MCEMCGVAIRVRDVWRGYTCARSKPRHTAQRDAGSNPLRLSFCSKVVVCGHCTVTLSLTINETLKLLSSLPIVMQEPLLVVTE